MNPDSTSAPTPMPAALFANLAATLLIGLNAGFFYTWSFTIMQSLDLVPSLHAVSVMQSINANIRTPWFGMLFFGAPVLALIATILNGLRARDTAFVLSAIAFVAIAANVATTVLIHLPWNAALGAVDPITLVDARATWLEYSDKWTTANHLRTLESVIAFLAMLMAGIRARR